MQEENQEPMQQNDEVAIAPEVNSSSPEPIALTEKPKKSRKKIVIILVLVAVMLAAAVGIFAYFSQNNSEEPKPVEVTVNQQEEKPEEKPTEKVWIINYYDVDTTKVVELAYDGSSLANIETAYSASPSGKYVSKTTENGVEVAPYDDQDNFQVVFEKGVNDSVSLFWYPDDSKMIVSTSLVTNKPATPGEYYVPKNEQHFYTINPDGSDEQKLFDNTEVYGSSYVVGVNPEDDMFYWASSGEGGLNDALNKSKLSTGELIEKLKPVLFSPNYLVDADSAYYISEGGSISKLDIASGDSSVLVTPIGELSGFDGEALTDNCNVGGSIDSMVYGNKQNTEVLFSTSTNKPHETKIQSLDTSTGEVKTLYTFDSVRQIKLLAADEGKVLFARERTNICNAQNEVVEVSDVYILDRASGEVVEAGIHLEQQGFGGSASLVERPIQ